MHLITGDRLLRTVCALTVLLTFSIWSLASVMPVGAQAIEFPLGLAAGSREAQITLDGKQWTPLTSSSSPLYDGAIIRTGNGVASVLLKDGTQLEFQPRSVMGISGSRAAPVVKIAIGRVLFRLPATSKTVLITPSVSYRGTASSMTDTPPSIRVAAVSPSSSDRIGEIVVTQRGASRIGLRQGEMFAKPVSHPGLHIVKAGQSVSIPQVGASDPSFKALLAQALPPSGVASKDAASSPTGAAVPVYDQAGKSLGYCGFDGSFVAFPGITRNLTTSVPAATIPPEATARPEVTPIFTPEPTYVGNLLGPTFTEAGPLRCECRPIPVYDQPGRSIGYIGQDGAFVSFPGYAPPLTNPVPAAKLPQDAPPEARPIFMVNSAYVGYLLGDNRLRDERLSEVAALCATPPLLAVAPVIAGAGVGAIAGGVVGGGLLLGLALLGGGIAAAVALSDEAASPHIP